MMEYKLFAIEESMIRSKINERMPKYCKIKGEEEEISTSNCGERIVPNYVYANFKVEDIEDYGYEIDKIILWCNNDDVYQVECPIELVDLDFEEWTTYLHDIKESIRDSNSELKQLIKKEKAELKKKEKIDDKASDIKLMQRLADELGYEILEKVNK